MTTTEELLMGMTADATTTGVEERPTVVVGVDGSPGSRAALVEAVRSAAARGAALEVVAVYEPPEWRLPIPGTPLPSGDEIEESLLGLVRGTVTDVLDELTDELVGEHRRLRQVEVDVVPGDAVEVLVAAARDADELVVGHRGRGALASTLLGSVGWGCVLHAPCPVRVVPDRHTTRSVTSAPTGS